MYEKVKKVRRRRKKLFKFHKVNRSVGGNIVLVLILGTAALFMALPLYYTVIQSLKPLNELWIFPPRFYVQNPTLKNFSELFTLMGNSRVPFLRYLFNTLFISAVGTFCQVVMSSMCAYPLAKHRFPGSGLIFKMIVLSLMFSPAVTGIPNYLILARLGWIDTYRAILVPMLSSTLGLYLMKQFMEQIHDAILESAKIDGAGEWVTFWRVVMPQVKPAWLTMIVFSVQGLWNIGATIMIYSEQLKTLPYALSQITAAGISRAGVASAVAVLLIIVPLTVFVFTQSRVIETMSSSGIKE